MTAIGFNGDWRILDETLDCFEQMAFLMAYTTLDPAFSFWRMLRVVLIIIMAIGLAVPMHRASARELGLKSCLRANAEKEKLLAQGFGSYVDQGPQQIRSRMTPLLLVGVKRLIYLTEVVSFRCDGKKMQAMVKRLKSPAFRRWRALKPPLPQRNPRFLAAQRR